MRDIRLAKARLLVPHIYLTSNGKGQGASFDPEREVYEGLNMMPPADGGNTMITPTQFAIRVAEHRDTAYELLGSILRGAGYSASTFGLAGEGGMAITATEINARERRSFVTRDRKARYWRTALGEIFETLLLVDAQVFRTKGVSPSRPDVAFGDSVQEQPRVIAETLDLLHRAEAVSTETKVRIANPDWDDDQVRAEVRRIREDTGRLVENPDTFTGRRPATGDRDAGGGT